MVNKISSIYSGSENSVGKISLFINVFKASAMAGGTQIGLNMIVDKIAAGATGVVLGSISQGLAVGSYVGRIGIEAMKQPRPIQFSEHDIPDLSLIKNGLESALTRLKNELASG